MFSSPQGITLKLPRNVKGAALAGSLVFSTLLTAVGLRTPEYHWLAWISFLPLFVVVGWLRPATPALAGGVWGASLYLFSTAGAWAPAQGVPAIQSWTLRQAQARAPPIPVAVASWNLVGSAHWCSMMTNSRLSVPATTGDGASNQPLGPGDRTAR
ncbi:MAG: hypothetical protein JSU86_05840 [Phycisphaerales bacterium]|nr:MAG: hypothetical protein JSU86_05840 [Phycisphaerales bacterium]